jgi:hypothetical protein
METRLELEVSLSTSFYPSRPFAYDGVMARAAARAVATASHCRRGKLLQSSGSIRMNPFRRSDWRHV